MRVSSLLIIFLLTLCSDAMAQVTFSMKNDNGKYSCSGCSDCRYDEKNTFGSAVLWTLENELQDKDMKAGAEFDYGHYVIKTYACVSDDSKENNYMFTLQMAVGNGKISYLVDDIRCIPQKGVFAAMKVVVFDKLNLKKKPQNQTFVDQFNSLCNNYISKAINNILKINPNIKHWDNIAAGQVVKGMFPNEVKLSKGKPINVSENSQRVVWTYDSGTVVMFENGIVTGVVN